PPTPLSTSTPLPHLSLAGIHNAVALRSQDGCCGRRCGGKPGGLLSRRLGSIGGTRSRKHRRQAAVRQGGSSSSSARRGGSRGARRPPRWRLLLAAPPPPPPTHPRHRDPAAAGPPAPCRTHRLPSCVAFVVPWTPTASPPATLLSHHVGISGGRARDRAAQIRQPLAPPPRQSSGGGGVQPLAAAATAPLRPGPLGAVRNPGSGVLASACATRIRWPRRPCCGIFPTSSRPLTPAAAAALDPVPCSSQV
ncbi:unnamed protein product, partial [Urochloa humidicola]